jgi:hypothetical protein
MSRLMPAHAVIVLQRHRASEDRIPLAVGAVDAELVVPFEAVAQAELPLREHRADVVRMDHRGPAIAQRTLQREAGEVEEGVAEERVAAVGAGGPHAVIHRLADRAVHAFALAQCVLVAEHLDRIGGVARAHVRHLHLALQRRARGGVMHREHAQQRPGARHDRRAVNRSEPGLARRLAERAEGGVRLRVGDDPAAAVRERIPGAAAHRAGDDLAEQRLLEAAAHLDHEAPGEAVVQPDDAEIRVLRIHGGIEDRLERGLEIGLAAQLHRELVQLRQALHLQRELVLGEGKLGFRRLALGDVHQHVDRAGHLAAFAVDGTGVGNRVAVRAVGTLDQDLDLAERRVAAHDFGHGASVERNGCALGGIHGVRAAPLVRADLGRAPPELHRGLVVVLDAPGCVGGVDGGRQSLDQRARMALAFAQLALHARAPADLVLRAAEQVRVVDRHRGLGGDANRVALGVYVEDTGVGVTEEKPPQHLAGARDHRNRQVALHRQVVPGHAMVGADAAVTRILRDVVHAHRRLPQERGLEDRRCARHCELLERLARCARQRVELERTAIAVVHAVEESAETRAGELRADIGHLLHDRLQVELRGDVARDFLQRLGLAAPAFLLARLGVGDAGRDLRGDELHEAAMFVVEHAKRVQRRDEDHALAVHVRIAEAHDGGFARRAAPWAGRQHAEPGLGQHDGLERPLARLERFGDGPRAIVVDHQAPGQGRVTALDARAGRQPCRAALGVDHVDRGERNVGGARGQAHGGALARGIEARRIGRTRGDGVEQVQLPVEDHALRDVAEGAHDAAGGARFGRARGEAVGVVRFLDAPVALDQQRHGLRGALLVAADGALDARPDVVPDFAPGRGRRLPQGRGMVAADEDAAGVVVEVGELGPPPDAHRVARREHDAHRRLQALGPVARGTERRAGPVVVADALAHRPSARHEVGRELRSHWLRKESERLGAGFHRRDPV